MVPRLTQNRHDILRTETVVPHLTKNLHDILRTEKVVPYPTTKTYKNLIEIGPYGSPCVHIERIRSHRCRTGFDIPKRDLVCYIKLNFGVG